jgi:predicted ATPase
MEAAVAHRAFGQTCLLQGELALARNHFERALALHVPGRDIDARHAFGTDTGVLATAWATLSTWLLGEIDYARRPIEQTIQQARASDHIVTIAQTVLIETVLEAFRGDPTATQRAAEAAVGFARKHDLPLYVEDGEIFSTWARGRLVDPRAGARDLQDRLKAYLKQGNRFCAPWIYGMIAELESIAGGVDGALATADQGLELAKRTGERWTDSVLFRCKGEILLQRDPANPTPAEEMFQTAIAVAKEQGSRSFGLQAALKLAKLYQSTAHPADAHAVLAPALEGFSPTAEMPEIAAALALLAALAETEEVKAGEAQHKLRLHLQTAYGNALIAARGYGAPETTEAFAKARESAVGDKDTPEWLAAEYGLWVGSFIRGELSPMKAHAEAFLGDVEARPDSPETGVAHRAAGLTQWFAGEYREARDHLERALALFQPGRDDDLAFRFGNDPGVAAMFNLGFTLWPLGDIARAVSLVGEGEARSAGHPHIGTRALGKMHVGMFELMHGDLARAALCGNELAQLTREHDLPMWRAAGVVLEGVAKAERGELIGGLADMRRAADLLREQNTLIFDGLFRIVLAEAEARAGDVGRALEILDEALATCERTGHRTFEAELHRVRGEMLLRRDLANPSLAEAAFGRAIEIAVGQGTRSFRLRAALSLGKHYQLTGRRADAHAVLAPALEGFSPAAEMPEIAEAQALVARLA